MTLAHVFSLVIVAGGALYFWRSFSAINGTYAQKTEILDAIKQKRDPFDRIDLLKDERRVTWKAHYHCVFWFKNPWSLYPETILKLMGRHEA